MEVINQFTKHNIYTFDSLIEIKNPNDFYRKIKSSLINSSNALIYTMYVGNGKKCKKLINLILDREKRKLKTTIVCDKNQRTSKILLDFLNRKKSTSFIFIDCSTTSLNFFRFKEISAQFHSKLYIFDDEIILTGANMDDFYFKNRLDRYFIVKNKKLADDLLEEEFMNEKNKNQNSINEKNKNQNSINEKSINIKINNNLLFYYGRNKEKEILNDLFNIEFDSVYLSSAYFNLPVSYYTFFKKQKNVNFFVSAPKYNIFNNFGWFGFLVSKVYEYSSYYTLKNLPNSTLYQFGKKGFTMHKKGIWAYKGNLCISITGSSNFNRRSSERDIELNFCIITQNENTLRLFNKEIDFLKRHSKIVNIGDFNFGWFKFLYILLFYTLNRYL